MRTLSEIANEIRADWTAPDGHQAPAARVGAALAAVDAGDHSMSPTFAFTGTMPTMTRSEAKALIEATGGSVTGTVTKTTRALIVGEWAGSRLDKARALGVPVLDEAGLRMLLAGSTGAH